MASSLANGVGPCRFLHPFPLLWFSSFGPFLCFSHQGAASPLTLPSFPLIMQFLLHSVLRDLSSLSHELSAS